MPKLTGAQWMTIVTIVTGAAIAIAQVLFGVPV
jgi:hypothetical protein